LAAKPRWLGLVDDQHLADGGLIAGTDADEVGTSFQVQSAKDKGLKGGLAKQAAGAAAEDARRRN